MRCRLATAALRTAPSWQLGGVRLDGRTSHRRRVGDLRSSRGTKPRADVGTPRTSELERQPGLRVATKKELCWSWFTKRAVAAYPIAPADASRAGRTTLGGYASTLPTADTPAGRPPRLDAPRLPVRPPPVGAGGGSGRPPDRGRSPSVADPGRRTSWPAGARPTEPPGPWPERPPQGAAATTLRDGPGRSAQMTWTRSGAKRRRSADGREHADPADERVTVSRFSRTSYSAHASASGTGSWLSRRLPRSSSALLALLDPPVCDSTPAAILRTMVPRSLAVSRPGTTRTVPALFRVMGRRLISGVAAVLVVGCGASSIPTHQPSGCVGSSASTGPLIPIGTSAATVQESCSGITFSYPTGWYRTAASFPGSFSDMVAAVSNQPLRDPCTVSGNSFTCGEPLDSLKAGAVLVEWWSDGSPRWSIAGQPGTPATVDGLQARIQETSGSGPGCLAGTRRRHLGQRGHGQERPRQLLRVRRLHQGTAAGPRGLDRDGDPALGSLRLSMIRSARSGRWSTRLSMSVRTRLPLDVPRRVLPGEPPAVPSLPVVMAGAHAGAWRIPPERWRR